MTDKGGEERDTTEGKPIDRVPSNDEVEIVLSARVYGNGSRVAAIRRSTL